MRQEQNINKIIYRDLLIILAILLSMTIGAWYYMFHISYSMAGMGGASLMNQWGYKNIFLSFLMWLVMMVAMMIPSAIPMIIMFESANHKADKGMAPSIKTGFFILGYLIVWVGYSAVAAFIQWSLHAIILILPFLTLRSSLFSGMILAAAGIYQWTSFRDACITKCRSPLGFIMAEWRSGKRGAFVMGLKHGMFCLGCCWLLMGISMVLGTMNLGWMAALTIFLIIEKSEIAGKWLSRIAGLVFIVWGIYIIG